MGRKDFIQHDDGIDGVCAMGQANCNNTFGNPSASCVRSIDRIGQTGSRV